MNLLKLNIMSSFTQKMEQNLHFQIVENLGTLIEFENESDLEGKTLEEINSVKQKMFEKIKNTGIQISSDIDIKKSL